jgi:hypothetical protein
MTRADYDDPFIVQRGLAVMSYREVAAALGLHVVTVRNIEHRALRKLRDALSSTPQKTGQTPAPASHSDRRTPSAGEVVEGKKVKTPNREIEGLTKFTVHETMNLNQGEVESPKSA